MTFHAQNDDIISPNKSDAKQHSNSKDTWPKVQEPRVVHPELCC